MFSLILSIIMLIVVVGLITYLLCGYMEPKLAFNATLCGFCALLAVTCAVKFIESFLGNIYRFITLQAYDNPMAFMPLLIIAVVAALVAFICGKTFIRLKREM